MRRRATYLTRNLFEPHLDILPGLERALSKQQTTATKAQINTDALGDT